MWLFENIIEYLDGEFEQNLCIHANSVLAVDLQNLLFFKN